jgi:hypothetical protein
MLCENYHLFLHLLTLYNDFFTYPVFILWYGHFNEMPLKYKARSVLA